MRRWKLSEQNFENFTVRGGSFFKKKRKKFSQNFQVLPLQAAITPQLLQIAENLLPNWPSKGCLNFHFTVNSRCFPWAVQECTTQIFGNVRFPIMRINTNSTPQCWCCSATDVWKESRLNWKLKISNAADNADITQSRARFTGHRRMQEVNSLCTDSGPLRANTVLCHCTKYSLLVIITIYSKIYMKITFIWRCFDILYLCHPAMSAKCFRAVTSATFVHLSGQILLPHYLINGLSNFDETYTE